MYCIYSYIYIYELFTLATGIIYSLMMPIGRKFGITLNSVCCSTRPLEEVDLELVQECEYIHLMHVGGSELMRLQECGQVYAQLASSATCW